MYDLPTRSARATTTADGRRYLDAEWRLADGRVIVLEVDGSFHDDVMEATDHRRRNRRLTTPDRMVVQCSAWEIRHEAWEVMEDLIALGVPTSRRLSARPRGQQCRERTRPDETDDRATASRFVRLPARPTQEAAVRIGIPRESRPGETLVAATAKTAASSSRSATTWWSRRGPARPPTSRTRRTPTPVSRVGTRDDVWASDVVVKVNAPTDDEIGLLRRGATVVALLAPARSPELVERLSAAGVTALAMDAVPRISRAQSMDVLSSMANVAGYRAVIEAAHEFGRLFTGQVTAAGKVPPARVFVVGAGVAGLAAIGAAGSLGAIVRAFDVRPEVAEQVESMGAQFVTVDMEQEVSSDGYAKEMTAEQEAATAAMYDEEARAADIVITTALIPGRPAPLLVTAETVAAMQPGSVVVDMAAANGGNVAATVTDQRVVTDNGVTVLGYTDLAGRLAAQTSQLYGTNIVNLLKLLTPEKDGQLTLDLDDVVQRGDHRQPRTARPCGRRRRSRSRAAPTGETTQVMPVAEGAAEAGRTRGGSGTPPGSAPWPSRCWRPLAPAQLPGPLHGVRARRGRRLLRHLQRLARPAHAADGGDQRHLAGSSWSAASCRSAATTSP